LSAWLRFRLNDSDVVAEIARRRMPNYPNPGCPKWLHLRGYSDVQGTFDSEGSPRGIASLPACCRDDHLMSTSLPLGGDDCRTVRDSHRPRFRPLAGARDRFVQSGESQASTLDEIAESRLTYQTGAPMGRLIVGTGDAKDISFGLRFM
jgi:hypothetical protein